MKKIIYEVCNEYRGQSPTVLTGVDSLKRFAIQELKNLNNYSDIINLSKEYECYITELEKIFNEYSNNFVLDDNGNKTFDINGIPIVQDNVKENYFNSLNNLLNLDIEVPIYTIDDKYFDYDDSDNRYDILSPIEMIQLQNIICDGDNNE